MTFDSDPLTTLFKKLKFRNKLLVSFLVIFIPLTVAGGTISFYHVRQILEAGIEKELNDATESLFRLIETSATISIRNRLEAIAEKNFNLTEYYYSKHRSGLLTRDEAIRTLEEIFLNQPIGVSGYIYILNSQGDIIIHPNDRVKGTNLSGYGFIRRQLAIKDGYLEYNWKNPGEATERPKALYMVYYKPLDWIISVSAYRGEFRYLVDINDVRPNVMSFKSGDSGYAYVLDMAGKAVVHPTFQGINLIHEAGQPTDFLKAMLSQKSGKLRYFWKNPGESAPREKIVIFKNLPEYGWIIGSTSYVDEVYQPLQAFQHYTAFAVVLVLTVGIPLIYLISRSVTRPLDILMQKLEAGSKGDFSVRMGYDAPDELGKLSGHFNSFMNRLEKYHNQVENEIRRNKTTQAALVENDLKLRGLFNQSFQYTGILSPYGVLEEVNRRALQLGGVTEADLLYKPLWETAWWSHDPDVRKEVKQAVEKAMEGELVRFETTTLSPKKEIRNLDISIKPVVNTEGNIEFMIMEGRDITDLKQTEQERRRLAIQLEKSQKMEAIGTLAGGIAHDFNNILSSIFGYTQLAQMNLTVPEKARRHIGQILKGAQRAAALIQQILTFSRQTEYQKRPLKIHLVVKEALKLLRSSIPTTIDIRVRINSQAMVLADPTQMHQVIMNLCTNAYHAMIETGGTLTVTLERIGLTEEAEALPDGDYLMMTVSDTGHGMDKLILEKAFDPYFTTKEVGKGTGFGLALVRAIVEEHEGFIYADSEPGKGSNFYVYLPMVAAETPVREPKDLPELTGGSETIMVVDDETDIRELVRELLESYGYTVHCFEDGIQALAAFQEAPDRFHLVITDLTMPNMAGDELAIRLMQAKKGVPVVLCTGYSERMSEARALDLGITRFVQKPIQNPELLGLIREVLDRQPAENTTP